MHTQVRLLNHMLIVNALNTTGGSGTATDGMAQYDVVVAINKHVLWAGPIGNHIRAAGAAVLLRRIADAMDAHPRSVPGSAKQRNARASKANKPKTRQK